MLQTTVPSLNKEFSASQKTGLLNGFFTSWLMKGMLGRKGYLVTNQVFPFRAELTNRVTGSSENAVLVSFHTTYSEILPLSSCESTTTKTQIETVKKMVKRRNCIGKTNLETWRKIFFTLKFNTIHHVEEDVKRFEDLLCVYASPYEHFSFLIKNCIIMTSMLKVHTV